MKAVGTQQKPESSRWCWECQRRRLVCDCARPVCNKCRVSGVVCPGYEDKKPLTWLAPGKVLSRTRKPRRGPSRKRAGSNQPEHDPELERPVATASCGLEVVSPRCGSAIPGDQLSLDMCDLAEAAEYYNSQVYPDLVTSQLGPNPFVVPMLSLHGLPAAMRHALVSIALSYRIYRSTPTSESSVNSCRTTIQKTWWTRLHHHRGMAIHIMNEDISLEARRSSDATITSVLVFLIGELQQSISDSWRHHVYGLMALLRLRGGFEELARTAQQLRPSLLSFLLIVITANTTTPAADQIVIGSLTQMKALIPDLYGIGIYPPFPCAQELLLYIVSINDLRARPARAEHEGEAQCAEAQKLVAQINAFSPDEWANLNPPSFRDPCLTVARIYQCAVTLYCISSLQSLGLLPPTPQLHTQRAEHRERLMILLTQGFQWPSLKTSLLWPLVVAGFEAHDGSETDRRFVARNLEEQSRTLGSSQPMVAKAVFERFWGGSKTRWDDCFDIPYAFLS